MFMKRIHVFSNRVKESRQIKTEVKNILQKKGFIVDSNDPDLIVVIGGDGTMLSCIRKFKDLGVPFIGINTGNLGFLPGMVPSEIELLPSILMERRFSVEEFPLMEVTAIGPDNIRVVDYCFNDVIIRHHRPKLMEALLFLDNKPFNYFTGDGFLISTPVGTTGYSIWAGGAAIHHSLNVFELTPLSPNDARINRPLRHSMILPMQTRVDIRIIKAYKREVTIACDGIEMTERGVSHITVKASNKKIQILKYEDADYFRLFKEKIIDKNIYRMLEDQDD